MLWLVAIITTRTCGFSAFRYANSSSSESTVVRCFVVSAVFTIIFLSVPCWEREDTESFVLASAMYPLWFAAM